MNLALAVLLILAAIFLEPRLTQASLVAWLAYSAPHFALHVAQIHHFSPFQNLVQLSGLGFIVLLSRWSCSYCRAARSMVLVSAA